MGTVTVSSGVVSSGWTIATSDAMVVSDGGVAINTRLVGWAARQYVERGGSAIQTTISGGTMFIEALGSVDSTTIESEGGSAIVSYGGTANSTTVNGGTLYVLAGGTATNINITSFGGLVVNVTGETYLTGIYRDKAIQVANGLASNVTIWESRYMNVSNGWIASNTTLNGWAARQTVERGGSAVGTIISSGSMYIDANGYANSTTIKKDYAVVSSGGTANSTSVTGGELVVSAGGTATNMNVASNGELIVDVNANTYLTGRYKGSLIKVGDGLASNVTIWGSRYMTVSDGWVASNTTLNGWAACQSVKDGGSAVGTIISSGSMYIDANGYAEGTTIMKDFAVVSSGGTAALTDVLGGTLYVAAGGTATDINVLSTGELFVNVDENTYITGTYKGSSIQIGDWFASNVTIWESRYMTVSDGWVASNTTLNGWAARQSVKAGGSAVGTIISSGSMYIDADGYAEDTTIMKDFAVVSSGGTAYSTTVWGGTLYVSAGGTATNINVLSTGELVLNVEANTYITGNYKGSSIKVGDGLASNVTIWDSRYIAVSDGWIASNTTLNGWAAYQTVKSGGSAVGTIISSGSMYISSGGYADSTIIKKDFAVVSSGGTANATTVRGGSLDVSAGGLATATTLSNGQMVVSSNGLATDTTLSGGSVFMSRGGVARNTIITKGGVYALSGGTADATTVSSGSLTVSAGGKAMNTVVDGGRLNLLGTHSGSLQITNSRGVVVSSGAVIDFTVSEQAYRNVALIDRFDYIYGSANASYTITVDNASNGTYVLADYAEGFDKELNVTVKSATGNIGTVSVNGAALVNGSYNYDLKMEGSKLLFSVSVVDVEKPSITNIHADVTDPTNGSVRVYAEATDNVGVTVFEYAIDDDENWYEYNDCVLVNQNCTVWFWAEDAAGNHALEYYVVNNIDKVAPNAPTATANITAPTNQNVKVTATFSQDSAQKQYSVNGGTWKAYLNGVTMQANGTVSFRGIDAAGNISQVTTYTVSNIDKVAPEAPTASASITTLTKEDVTVTAVFSEDSVTKQYSLNGSSWSAYTAPVVMSNNGTVYFRGIDAVGNISEVTSLAVANIDKTAPELASLDISDPNDSGIVTVTFAASEELSQFQYSWNDGDWTDVPGGELAFSENGTIQFRMVDLIGNETVTQKYSVKAVVPVSDDWTDMATMGPNSNEVGNFGVAETWSYVEGEVGKNDRIDYMSIDLASAASLSFTVGCDNAAKFTIWQLQSKAGKNNTVTYSLKSLQSTTLKAGLVYQTKNLLLDAGTYYFSMEATDKKASDDYYVVAVNDKSVFFDKGDNSDDWGDMKTMGAEGAVGDLGVVSASGALVEDGWVGYGDAIDYMAVTLNSAANIAFALQAGDAAKFNIFQLQEKVTKGVSTYSLKSLQSTTLKKDVAATTKKLLLNAGTYYLAMEGTNAKKGGSADYTIAVNASTDFFDKGDNSDDWGDMKTMGTEGAVGDLGVVSASGALVEDGWVGYGDAIDYAAITLEGAANIAFTLQAGDAAKFNIFQLQEKVSKGVSTYSLKSLQSTTLKKNVAVTTKNLLLDVGTYYIAMENTNAKKGSSADYTVDVSGRSTFFEVDHKDDNTWNGGEVAEFDGEWNDWVGFGDALDYREMTLDCGARVAFDLEAGDATKFTLWQLDEKTSRLKSVQATTLKADKTKEHYSASTKELLLKAGTYYVSMESTNAKKGGNADFTVTQGERFKVFDGADNSNDTWKAASENEALAIGDSANGWVGFGDTVDFHQFQVEEAGKLTLTFDEDTEAALKAKQIKLSCLDAKGKAVSLAAFKNGSVDSSKALGEGTYYLGVTCANAQKYDTSYSVNLGMLA
ncbi:MAG: hypothetical protein J5746_00230 [Victivallales bacterium]|nr:hypothetical protein [Victivallales bacterium]